MIEIVLGDTDHVRASSSYQVNLSCDYIKGFYPEVKEGEWIRLNLPLTARPNHLLLGVDITGPNDSYCPLLLKEISAPLHASYIRNVVENIGDQNQEVLSALWEGICLFTPEAWRHHEADKRSRIDALKEYLAADIQIEIEESDIQRWLDCLEPVNRLLAEAIDEERSNESPSECILLALPFMPIKPVSTDAIDELVEQYIHVVTRIDVPSRAVLSNAGRRWEVFVDATVQIGSPCKFKLSEQRPWIDAPSPYLEQELTFGDARATHVEIRVSDHTVVLDQPKISDIRGVREGIAICDALRETQDAIAIYASDPTRPQYVKVGVRAKVRFAHRLVIWLLLLLIFLALTAAVLIPEGPNLVDSLALLTFPLTLAGTVVLTRETSALAERLLYRWRWTLGIAILALWCVNIARLLVSSNISV